MGKRIWPRNESRRMRKLRDALEAVGHTKVRIRWELIGPAFEMCGHSGGCIFESKQTKSGRGPSKVPIGLTLDEALSRVRLYAPDGR